MDLIRCSLIRGNTGVLKLHKVPQKIILGWKSCFMGIQDLSESHRIAGRMEGWEGSVLSFPFIRKVVVSAEK